MDKSVIKYNVKNDFPVKGVKFIDFMPTFDNFNLMMSISYAIAEKILGSVDYIIMPESRGFLLGTFVAMQTMANMIPIRKHGKIPEDFIGATEEYETEYSKTMLDIPKIDLKGKRCYFIDDVYATGGTYRACKRLVEKMGGKMIGGHCIYDVGIEEQKEVECFLTKEDIK